MIRVSAHDALSVWMCARLGLVPLRSWLAGRLARTLSVMGGFAALLAGTSALGLSLVARAAIVIALMIPLSLTIWRHGLRQEERQTLVRTFRRLPLSDCSGR